MNTDNVTMKYLVLTESECKTCNGETTPLQPMGGGGSMFAIAAPCPDCLGSSQPGSACTMPLEDALISLLVEGKLERFKKLLLKE